MQIRQTKNIKHNLVYTKYKTLSINTKTCNTNDRNTFLKKEKEVELQKN